MKIKTKQNNLKIFTMCILFLVNSHLMAQSSQTLTQTVCAGSSEPYEIQNPDPSSTYTWSLDNSNGTISSGQGSAIITIDWLVITGTDVLRMVETNNGCAATEVTLAVTIVEYPIANAGVDFSICAGDTYPLLATDQNAISGLWSGGVGSFNPNNGDPNAVYTPDPTEIGTAVDLTWTVIGSGDPSSACYSNSSTMSLTITPAPTADAGGAGEVCEGLTFTLSSATATNSGGIAWGYGGGDGSFDDNTLPNPTYTPGANDILTGSVDLTIRVDGNASCSSTLSTMTLTIVPVAIADAGLAASICEGSTHTISGSSASNNAGVSWSSSGTGAFTNGTTLTPTYTPSAADILAGSVTLTLTATGNTPCSDATSPMVLTIVPAPIANAGSAVTLCEGENYLVVGSSITNGTSLLWTSSGNGAFDDNTLLSPTYTPSSTDITNGTVTLTLTVTGTTPCLTNSNNMIITINPLPTPGPIFHN